MTDTAAVGSGETKKAEAKIKLPQFLTVSPSPHIKSPETTTTVMLDVLIALIPAFVWGVYVFGMRALAVALISVIACVAFEAAAQFILHRPVTIGDLSACVTGLLLAMNLPVTVPLWMPVIGAFFAIVVVKQLFGGIGKNFVNPALAARVFLFSWAAEMTRFTEAGSPVNSFMNTLPEADIVASATPLASLKNGALPDVNLFDMLIGNRGGCIGEVSALLIIAGAVYLLVRRVITWHIPVAYIGTVAILTFFFPQYDGVAWNFMVYELLSGGLMLGAFFMATDYSTSAVTPVGRLVFGVGCGAITVLIRYFGSYNEGVSFAILIMNLLVWYIDKVTMPRRFGGGKNGK
ncbi:MAG: RnfABCDGE type electron transport complex subunit D [Ruminococcaceae bacterium]|nr:RnfABCDGE type electron transport complex subunit D [Oscillospiraceae bacterium]